MAFARQRPSNHQRNNRSAENNNNVVGRTELSRYILVHNLNKLTKPATLLDYFNRFEKVDKVFLNEDDNENLNGTATIVFSKIPRDVSRLITRHKVDGATVTVEFTNDVSTEQFYYSSNRRANKSVKFFAKSLSFGSLIGPKQFVSEWTTSQDVRYILQYTQRRVHIFFTHLETEYKMEYKFKDVFGDMHFERQNDTTILTIPLRYPGIFWKRNNNSVTEKARSISVGYSWERVTLIPLTKGAELVTKLTKPLTPISRTDVVNIAYWRVLRLTFRPYPKFVDEFEKNLKEAASFNLVPEDLRSQRPPMEVIPASRLPKPLGHVERSRLNLPFDVLYLLESIVSYHYVNQYNLTDVFYNQLKQLEPDISCGLLNYVALSKKIVYDPALEFNRIWNKKGMKVKDQRSIPSHCAMLRKAIITPSHMYIQPPSLETTNRVVRHYREYSDRFIRVQFMDEGFNRVGPSLDQKTKEVMYTRIYQILKRGIQIGDRRYEFLAFSSSQLREQGCWFFAPTADLTPDMIRSWMGVFSHEKVVAKHAVRMGQCFSSTRPVYILREDQVAYIDDIKRNGYTFSDGVGKISPSLAEEVAIQMDLRMTPSAFQFRLGGAKGVLTVDKSLADEVVKVQLRPSQIKFESKHLTLEVIRTSTFINGYLNRQVITLLSSLGVKDEVFMELMDNMLLEINKMLEKPSEAVRVLQSNADSVGTVKSMVSLIQAGFLERKDPYITNLLSLFRINVLKDLKKKAKIIVPNGAYLLGVMDETDTLEEGEVFVQIYNNTNNNAHKEIITGEVVVFRNPCFHPGDVRVVKAVDKPNLHHLIDVVVFSAKGFRDIPSMCSGGDLDGDDYTVYWDPRLIPKKKNFPPMDYTAAPSKVVSDVTIRDIIKFFVNYISHDNLGQIANAHLATADQSDIGARDGKCILLAQLHSEAVDFPKSGKPANLTRDLIVKVFPDFMQKKDKESYESKKVLGRIFRAIDKSNYKDYKAHLTEEAVYDVRLFVPGMEAYIKEARERKSVYNRNLSALMNQFGVQTEAEICSGYIIKWLKKGKSKTRFEQHDYTMNAVQSFKKLWQKDFEKEFCDSSKVVDLTQRAKIDAKAAAWYYVTYHPEERKRDLSLEGGFLSFPWCIYEYICDIANRNRHKLLDEVMLSQPIDEGTIYEANKKLQLERGDQPVIVDSSDDDEDASNDYEYDSSSDDEVITYNARASTSGGNAAAATGRNNNTLVNTGAIVNPITYRPLEPHQSIISADATMEELSAALFRTLN
ncbi:hypothetical protein MFLAVUS_006978 [Mucor flavus]|uniref:RNA-dependent RNA polymerase n=1 Tax=Mucor flavus TaxID=439312 RepID=A0ABP9Z307_9FUNG